MAINVVPDVTWHSDDVFQGTTFNIPRPAGITVGMFLTIAVGFANTQADNSTSVSIAGWNQYALPATDGQKFAFWRIADAGDTSGGNWICTCSDGFIEQWSGMGWINVDNSTPFAVGPSLNAASLTTFTFGSLTSPGVGSIWMGHVLLAPNSTSKTDPTPPPTNRVESTSGFYFAPNAGYSAQVDSGSFSPTGTEGAAFEWATVAAFLNPAGAGAPTIDTQPSSVTKIAGETASFSVSATASGGTLSYQWQLSTNNGGSWADITGAVSTVYTTFYVGLSDSGNKYRVNVTDSNGTLASSAATLTVVRAKDFYPPIKSRKSPRQATGNRWDMDIRGWW